MLNAAETSGDLYPACERITLEPTSGNTGSLG